MGPGSFEDMMEDFLKSLFKMLYVTIRIISQSAEACIRELLSHCLSIRSLGALLAGAADPHKEVSSEMRYAAARTQHKTK